MTRQNILTLSNDEKELEKWDAFVQAHPRSSIYHLSIWSELIREVFGHKSHYLYRVNQSREIQGVLPMVRLKSHLFGDYLVSMPYFNYGGAIACDEDTELELMHYAATLAQGFKAQHIEFRDTVQKTEFQSKQEKVSMILQLPETQEQLWKSLGAKRRSQINRPLRENPKIKEGSLELLGDFYEVFAKNMRDLGTPVYSKRFFKAILNAFPKQSRLMLVYLNNKPVGGAFLLGYKGVLEIPWASTLKEVNSLSINMLMYWEVLKYAFRNDYQAFDFGRCSIDSGTYRFKKQWGSQPRQYYWHYWMLDDKPLPELNPNNPKYKLAISVWKKLPLFVTKLIGPELVKSLP